MRRMTTCRSSSPRTLPGRDHLSNYRVVSPHVGCHKGVPLRFSGGAALRESRVLVASGGSGDLVASALVNQLPLDRVTVAYATAIWERSALDRFPGPRSINDVDHLSRRAGGWVVTPATRLPGGWTPVPEFAGMTAIPVYFLDATRGPAEIGRQLRDIATATSATTVELVDAGGDILALGTEQGLVSPALDVLMLAGAMHAETRSRTTVIGAGLDGELSAAELTQAARELSALSEEQVTCEVASALYRRFAWFPSEASLMTMLAARGLSGRVDIRADCRLVELGVASACAVTYDTGDVAARSALVPQVYSAGSIFEADEVLRRAGLRSELQLERSRASGETDATDRPEPPTSGASLLDAIHPKATHVTHRRLAKQLACDEWDLLRKLDLLLSAIFGVVYTKPLLPVAALAPMADRLVEMRQGV